MRFDVISKFVLKYNTGETIFHQHE